MLLINWLLIIYICLCYVCYVFSGAFCANFLIKPVNRRQSENYFKLDNLWTLSRIDFIFGTLHKGMDSNSCTKFGRVASSQSLFIGSPKKQGDKQKLLKNWLCHSFWTLSCIALIFDTEHKGMDPNSYIKFDHVSSFQSLSIGLSRKKPDNAIFCTQCHINVFHSQNILA